MTDCIREQLWQPTHQLLLDYVRRTLEADAARRQASAEFRQIVQPVDVERLFASIELLIDRYEQPWSPFVSAWTAGLESFAPDNAIRVGSLSMPLNRFASAIDGLLGSGSRGHYGAGRRVSSALEDVVKRAIEGAQPRDVSQTLHGLREEMIRSLLSVLNPTRSVEYLDPLLDLAHEQRALTVATLNYDRCMELAAERKGTSCDTAIESWLREPSQWPETGIRLLKLHGSVDWVLERGSYALPEMIVRTARLEESVRQPAIVFGEGGKLRSEGPYLELLLQWARAIDEADRLLIVGYSFRDEHVNESIARWFNRDETRRIVTVSPDELQTGYGVRSANPFLSALALVDTSLPNQAPKPRRLWHVQERAAEGLSEAITRIQDPNEWELSTPEELANDAD
jgi:hypothetical protein